MGLSELGYEVPIGELQGFALTMVLFVVGATLFILPDQKLENIGPTE